MPFRNLGLHSCVRWSFFDFDRGKGKKQKLASATSQLPATVNVMSQQPTPIDVRNNRVEINLQQQKFPRAKAFTQRWSSTSSFLSQRSSSLMSAAKERIRRPVLPRWTVPPVDLARQRENLVQQTERIKSMRANVARWRPPSSFNEWKLNAHRYISKKEDDEDESYILGYYLFSFAVGLTFDMLF